MKTTPEKQGRENFTEWCIAEYGEHYNDGCSCGDLPWKCWSAAWSARDAEVEAMAKEIEGLREALRMIRDTGNDAAAGLAKTTLAVLAQAKPTIEEGK